MCGDTRGQRAHLKRLVCESGEREAGGEPPWWVWCSCWLRVVRNRCGSAENGLSGLPERPAAFSSRYFEVCAS